MSIFTDRKNYKPFEYDALTRPFIEAIWASHWTHKEFTFDSDIHQYHTELTEVERQVITRAVLLISQVEVSVKSYWSNIGRILPKPEIADVGATFGGNEVIHARAYSEILTKLGLNESFQNLLSTGVVNNRVTYLSKYVNKIYKNDHKNIVYSLILFTLFTENVSLFSQFYVLLGFNRMQNVLKDIANVVQYTSKEEDIHAKFGITLINQIRKESPELFDTELIDRIKEETVEAINAEMGLISWMLEGYESPFLSETILVNYVKYRINTCLKQIDIDFELEVDTEVLEKTMWMEEEILASAMTDFFNKKPIEYNKKTQSFEELW